MLLVLLVQTPGVDAAEDDRRDDDAVCGKTQSQNLQYSCLPIHAICPSLSLGIIRVGGSVKLGNCVLDGELAPEVCERV